jgi:GNAT superfamily N-acetyltransferase
MPPALTVRPIGAADWPDILAIQVSAYGPALIETEAVLRSKASPLPAACFVATRGDRPLAYLLAHPYPPDAWPCLDTPLADPGPTDNLLLHDLAVHARARGQGAAASLMAALADAATRQAFCTLSLVAVQDAEPFWRRFGFTPIGPAPAEKGYDADACLMRKLLRGKAG